MHDAQTRPIPNLAWDALLEIRGADGVGPFHARLAGALREAIRVGRLPGGSAVLPSRQLATELRCSRWAVTEAYEQLIAEGYLEGRVGSATRVRPQHLARARTAISSAESRVPHRYDLRPGLADLHAFPRAAWTRAIREVIATTPAEDLAYPPRGGHLHLRAVIADYLHRVRGAAVNADDVTITSGIVDGLMQLTRALAAAGHRAIAVENPAWIRLFEGVRQTGLELVPIGVDSEGMRVHDLRFTRVRATLVAPAHQFPTGNILSPSRRGDLLEWARRVDGLILEDDYDAEFRYDRRPIGALQGLAPDRVALFGSLSKTLAPAIGLGWAVTPPHWTAAMRSVEPRLTGPSTLEQLTLARFIESGAYDRHLRHARRSYRSRRDMLSAALARALPDCTISGAEAGMHFVVQLSSGVAAADVVSVAAADGLRVAELRTYWLDSRPAAGAQESLVIGYSNLADERVEEAAAVLARAVRTVRDRDRRPPQASRP